MINKEVYLKEILEQVPRLLGLMNRNPLSDSYGCFDRQYWQYNTTDTATARSQEAVLTLALLYNIKKTPYYNNDTILEWIDAGIGFWIKIQEKNGSFNEWYPHENSYVATAFSCYAIAETLILIGNKLTSYSIALKTLEKSGEWLIKNKESRVQNQESGAIIALYNIYLLTKRKKFLLNSRKKLSTLIESQNEEGWFLEYGGADIGYLSLLIDYLTKYYQKTKDKRIVKVLDKGVEFISYFIHPNNTFGGEYGSRNTEYLIPSGFEYLAKYNKYASIIAMTIRDAIKNKKTISPSSLDDRYLTYITYNWLHAYLNAPKLKQVKPRYTSNFIKNLKHSQIFIVSDNDLYLIVNYAKGGSFKLFTKNVLIYDSGILVKTNKALMSGNIGENKLEIKKDKIKISGFLSQITHKTMTPIEIILSRLFQLIIGKNQIISRIIKEKLRDMLITNKKQSDIRFSREISFKDRRIIDKVEGRNLNEIRIGTKYSFAYTPSSRYFQISELNNNPILIRDIKAKKKKITREIKKGSITYKVD